MSNLKNIYKASAPSKLIKVFDAGTNWNTDIYCKPCPKRSYAFWIADLAQYSNLEQHQIKDALGGFTEMMAKLICLCACDNDGTSLFDYEEDVIPLTEMDDPEVLEQLFTGACQACGIEALAVELISAFKEVDTLFDGLGETLNDNKEKTGAAKGNGKKQSKKAK